MVTVNDSASLAFGTGALSLIGSEHRGPGATLYSLIDGAKFAGLAKLRLPGDGSVELHSLLGEMAQQDALYAGPVLLRHALGEHCPVLASLLATADSANFMSLFVSGQPLYIVRKRLTWLTDVAHEDGTEWVMRYYDPLILPHWLDVLDEAQRTQALAGIGVWLYTDVRGRPQLVPGLPDAASAAVDSEPMRLTQPQCDELMNRTLPYMVMQQLESDDPQVLSSLAPHDRYDYFAGQLGKAHGYGLVSPTDLKTYCMLSLMVGAGFDAAPLAADTLKDAKSGPSFSQRVLAWTPEQWASLEETSASGA